MQQISSIEQPETILIIDDDPTHLAVITNHCKGVGYQVLNARNQIQTQNILKNRIPDLILLGEMTPHTKGLMLCRWLTKQPILEDIPIIFMMTSKQINAVKAFREGAVDYVVKPFEQDEVIVRIQTHLRMRQLTKNLKQQNKWLMIVNEISQQISSYINLDELFAGVAALIRQTFDLYTVSIWMVDANHLKVKAVSSKITLPTNYSLAGEIPLKTGDGIILRAFSSCRPYLANDISKDPHFFNVDFIPDAQSELALPLLFRERILGVIDLQSDELNAFNQDAVDTLKAVTNHLAITIHNASLYESERLLRQQEAEQTEMLRQLNQDKDRFFSIVAHDLRAPFHPIMELAKMLSEYSHKDDIEMVQLQSKAIYDSAKQVNELLNNLLQWARIEQGKMEWVPAPLSLSLLLMETVDLLRQKATQKQINIINEIQQLPLIYADENMVKTILRNLLSNAIKFTEISGLIQICVSEQTPSTLTLIIKDNGIGIKAEHIHKLFQLDSHHTTRGTDNEAGTGLGLVLCQEMALMNGGSLQIDSVQGEGTAVSLTLPLFQQVEQTPLAPAKEGYLA